MHVCPRLRVLNYYFVSTSFRKLFSCKQKMKWSSLHRRLRSITDSWSWRPWFESAVFAVFAHRWQQFRYVISRHSTTAGCDLYLNILCLENVTRSYWVNSRGKRTLLAFWRKGIILWKTKKSTLKIVCGFRIYLHLSATS